MCKTWVHISGGGYEIEEGSKEVEIKENTNELDLDQGAAKGRYKNRLVRHRSASLSGNLESGPNMYPMIRKSARV